MDTKTGILSALRKNDIVLDVGAHNGSLASDIAAEVGSSGRVYAFECHPLKFFQLSHKVCQLTNVNPYSQAISNTVGHSQFYFGDAGHADQASTLCSDLAVSSRLGKVSTCRVETTTIDSFCKLNGVKPDFIKIDTEGAEDRVLQGARKTLLEHHPVLYFEFAIPLSNERPGVPAHFQELRAMGYQLKIAEIGYLNCQWTILDSPQDERVLVDFQDSDILSSNPSEKNILGNILAFHPSFHSERLSEFKIISFQAALRLVRSTSLALSLPALSSRLKLSDWVFNKTKNGLRLWLPPILFEFLVQVRRKLKNWGNAYAQS